MNRYEFEKEFECKECGETFTVTWALINPNVTCTHCKVEWETDWDMDEEDSVIGPWLWKPVGGKATRTLGTVPTR